MEIKGKIEEAWSKTTDSGKQMFFIRLAGQERILSGFGTLPEPFCVGEAIIAEGKEAGEFFNTKLKDLALDGIRRLPEQSQAQPEEQPQARPQQGKTKADLLSEGKELMKACKLEAEILFPEFKEKPEILPVVDALFKYAAWGERK